jgi:hypothetical protein
MLFQSVNPGPWDWHGCCNFMGSSWQRSRNSLAKALTIEQMAAPFCF